MSQDYEDRDAERAPSKTQVKQAMHELQALGEALLELPDARLDDIEMEDNLREALRTVRGIRTREARRRQLQYVGKLLRMADVEPMRRAMADYRAGQTQAAQAFQAIEQWRDRLLDDDDAITLWIEAHPATDIQRLRVLIRNARRERTAISAQQVEGGAARKGRYYRELFQRLRAEMDADGG